MASGPATVTVSWHVEHSNNVYIDKPQSGGFRGFFPAVDSETYTIPCNGQNQDISVGAQGLGNVKTVVTLTVTERLATQAFDPTPGAGAH